MFFAERGRFRITDAAFAKTAYGVLVEQFTNEEKAQLPGLLHGPALP